MTVKLWPAPGIHVAAIDEDLIVLDVQGDQYSCLTAISDWLQPASDGSILVFDEDAAAELVETGLVVEMRPLLLPQAPAPVRDYHPDGSEQAAPFLSTFLSLIVARRLFRGRPFAELVEMRPQVRVGAVDQLDRVLAAYAAVFPWCPGEGECLQRAFELRYLLANQGVAATWVFGVRTWPFAAHCWLQIGDMVVGDTVARVRRYTPILAV